MRIRFLSFMGIRGLDGLQKELPHKDLDLVVVHGGFARGKTCFLDTIAAAKEAVGEYGHPDQRWGALVGSNSGSAKVRIDWEPSEAELTRAGSNETLLSAEAILGHVPMPPQHPKLLQALLTQKSDAEHGSVHYLQDNRDLAGPLSYGAAEAAFAERLTTRNTKYSEIYDMLDQPQYAAARALANKRLAELFPQLEIVGLKRSGISFIPALRDRESGAERTIYSLSSSERQAFLISMYVSRAPIVDSVLLFDAPEIGFGDEGAVEIVRALLRWTTKTQIIVATASNAVRAMTEVAHHIELPSAR
jgi:ABC-type uncharacterized transport system ATPase subunit